MDMQESTSNYPATSKKAASHIKTIATKAEKRIAFMSALKAGCNKVEAAKAAGVSYTTAITWSKTLDVHMPLSASGASIADKKEIAGILSSVMRDDAVAPRDKVMAVATHSRLMGYEAPTRSEVTIRQVPASVIGWLDSLATAGGDADDATTPAAPQLEVQADSLSSPPIISQISTKGRSSST